MAVTTIASIATPPGQGGVGIIRISGPNVPIIMKKMIGQVLKPRYAYYGCFNNDDDSNQILDQGIAIYFQAPNSLTGEDILELQGHGGMLVLESILESVLKHGARLAEPGEFLKRAYLNNKLDLTKAEAIADLISASSSQAVKSALASMSGMFAQKIEILYQQLTELRSYVEAAINFPDEEIDFLSHGKVHEKLTAIIQSLIEVKKSAKQGTILQEGMKLVLMGKPNVGKSSLLNYLAGTDKAIVTDIAGTTRDILSERIQIDGMPIHVFDTAGLRLTDDRVEQAGIERAITAIQEADRLLLITDEEKTSGDLTQIWPEVLPFSPPVEKLTICLNKIDLTTIKPGHVDNSEIPKFNISIKQTTGLSELKEHLKAVMGYVEGEGTFTARRRHLVAIDETYEHLHSGLNQLTNTGSGELLAEDLYYAQKALGQITGKDSVEDLLDNIFSNFCIGK